MNAPVQAVLAFLATLHPKVVAGGSAGAAATAIVVILGAFGVNVPPDAAAAAVTLISVIAGYLKPLTPKVKVTAPVGSASTPKP